MNAPTTLEHDTAKLVAYCHARQWSGYDPYDALNSKVFTKLPILDAWLPRLLLTQALKRSPVNVRRFALVPSTQNPKAIALFLGAFLRLSKLGGKEPHDRAGEMIDRLVALRSPGTPYWCWGYSFPWQTRTVVVPAWTPNLVCTTFVASALIDAYEQRGDSRCLEMAASAGHYIVNELHWTEGLEAGFSYPLPGLRGHIHNANFLAAALLCRLRVHTGDDAFLGPALAAARSSAAYQRHDGSWPYSEGSTHQWIDNFHTGYNLCGLQSIATHAPTTEFDACIGKGFRFYRTHFFRPDGAARYFHDRTYPIDIHCVAQSIITLLALRHLDPDNIAAARAVFRWAMEHMWDPRGFFYYRVLRLCTIRTSYMRWSQAWMLLAMATLLTETATAAHAEAVPDSALAEAC